MSHKREVVLLVHDGFETFYNPDYHIIKNLDLCGSGWKYEVVNTDISAENGYLYFVNTSGGNIIITLPENPDQWTIVGIMDYANTFYTNNCIVHSPDKPIEGLNEDLVLNTNDKVELVFVDNTIGWKVL